MALYVASLNSGSNGNCYYVGNDTEAVLIDAGISCREIEKRIHRMQLNLQNIKAIFVSHEHGDHITGVTGLSKKYNIPVYITTNTHVQSGLPIEASLVKPFTTLQNTQIGKLAITAFAKAHDACDPHSFVITDGHTHVGVFTDIGTCCEKVNYWFSRCHAVILEANYDDAMLEKGNYPYHLKRRISGKDGHLSNHQALQLFLHHKHPQMSHLILGHLSKNNNCPILVKELFTQHAGNVAITVASRYEETEVFTISVGGGVAIPRRSHLLRKKGSAEKLQLSLF